MDYSLTRYTYEVFLSFRGEEVRKGFVDHLYNAMTSVGFEVFRDENEIRIGGDIERGIKTAIHSSKMSVIVFSPDFASSKWCLDEVEMIMERRKNAGHVVLPIFYDVEPDHVSNLTGRYATAFAVHENNFMDDKEKVQRWKEAVQAAAGLGGMVLRDRHEAQFIQNIIEEVAKNLQYSLCIPCFSWNRHPAATMIGVFIFLINFIGFWVGFGYTVTQSQKYP